jgi:hypothetical protein
MGVSVHQVLDEFFDEYILELRLFHLCGLSACSPSSSASINSRRVSFKMYTYNSVGQPPL